MSFDAGAVVGRLEMGIAGWKSAVETVKKDQQSLTGFAIRHKDEIQKLGKEFTIAGGAIVAALGAAVKITADYGDKINDLSQRTGVATEILSGYKLAADNSGTSIDGLATGFKFLSQKMVDANTGGKESIAMFKSLGVEVRSSDGTMRDSNAVMLDLADRFKGMEDGAQKTALAVDIFGRSGMELIPFLNLGKAGLKDNYEAALRFGGVISKEAAKACDDFNDSLGNMKAALGGATREIGMALMPSVKTLVEQVTSAVVKFREWAKEHGPVVEMATKISGAMGGASIAVGGLLLGFAKFAPILGGLASAWGVSALAMSGFIGAAVAATASVATLIGTLVELRAAEEYEAEAGNRAAEANRNLIGKLQAAATAAGMSAGAFADLVVAHNANAIAVRDAIFHDEKYTAIKKILTDQSTAYQEKLEQERVVREKATFAALAAKEAAEAVKRAAEEYVQFLNSLGIQTEEQHRAKLVQVTKAHKDLDEMLRAGKISLDQYEKAQAKLNDTEWDFGIRIKTVLPPARDLSDAFKQSSPVITDLTKFTITYDQILDQVAADMGYSAATARLFAWEMARLALACQGIVLPDLRIPDGQKTAVRQDVDDFKHLWDGFFNDVSQKWGDTIKDFIAGNTSIVTAWNRLWKNMGETITDFIGKYITEKLIKAIQGIIEPSKTATEEAGGAFTSMGTTIASVATSIGTVITTLVGAIVGCVELIAKTVIDIVAYGLTTLAEAIATAASSLAAAAPSLLIVGAVALALYAGFRAINELIGSGGGGSGDGMGRVVERLDNFLAGWTWWYIDMAEIAAFQQGQNDTMIDRLDWIGNLLAGQVTDAINSVAGAIASIPGAATGAMVMGPSFIRVGEDAPRIPEVILPLPELGAFARSMESAGSAAGMGGGGAVTVNLNGPLIHTTGVSRADLERAGEELFSIIQGQAERHQLRFSHG
jgi:TP901 family phage tail tape measure protein